MRACGWAVAVALLSLLAACDGRPEPAMRPAAAATSWHTLGTWSGRGNRQTESFDVTTGALRVRWETRGEISPGAGRFRVSLHSAISGRPLQTIVEGHGTGAGTAHVEDDPRVSYLEIVSDQVEWQVTIEEAVPAGTGRGPSP